MQNSKLLLIGHLFSFIIFEYKLDFAGNLLLIFLAFYFFINQLRF